MSRVPAGWAIHTGAQMPDIEPQPDPITGAISDAPAPTSSSDTDADTPEGSVPEMPFPWPQEYLSATEIMVKTMLEQAGQAIVNMTHVQETAAVEKARIAAEERKADKGAVQQTERQGQKLGAAVAIVGIIALVVVIIAGVTAGAVKEVTEAAKEIVLLAVAAFGLFKWGQARGEKTDEK